LVTVSLISEMIEEALDGVENMKCRSCGATNRKDSKFCKECGSSLTVNLACPRCHFVNLPDSTYCTQCGSRLSIQRKPMGTQKRCQSCGYLNDVDAAYCYYCNQKILEEIPE
jgi:RNA polymerase subunit RPABC4/transcription elongation factor Spt4